DLTPNTVWGVLPFVYAFLPTRIPVWMQLLPRDYDNLDQMLLAFVNNFLGVIALWYQDAAPMLNSHIPADSPPCFTLRFITIDRGALSGFHSLVASGTTAKQIDKETDTRMVGYLGAAGEGALAVCSILACTAGVVAASAAPQVEWHSLYSDFDSASAGATGNFVQGVGQFANNLGVPLQVGVIFAVVVVVSFAATTMDTGVRLQRYIVQEIAEIVRFRPLARNLTLATLIATIVPLGLALVPGDFAFGT